MTVFQIPISAFQLDISLFQLQISAFLFEMQISAFNGQNPKGLPSLSTVYASFFII